MVLRFGNAIFEHLWSSAHIDHVQITAAESVGWKAAPVTMTAQVQCATWCRTMCCSCSA